MLLQFKEQQFQIDAASITAKSTGLFYFNDTVICPIAKIRKRLKNLPNILFSNKINCTFRFPNKKHNYSVSLSTLIHDNTPPRLAAMQHTWGVFSFYTSPKPVI